MSWRAIGDAGMSTVAALFVDPRGCYAGLPGIDLWDEVRDARKYSGPHTVVAHPPCSRWCQLAHVNQKRYGHKVGDDGGCFEAALAAVRRWGGVLEHPAFSYAWPAFGLPAPVSRGWSRTIAGEWVAEVSQYAYGHPARKLTWLLYVGDNPPPVLDWSVPAPSGRVGDLHHRPKVTAQVSFCKNHGNSKLRRLGKREASATPPSFRDALISMARNAR